MPPKVPQPNTTAYFNAQAVSTGKKYSISKAEGIPNKYEAINDLQYSITLLTPFRKDDAILTTNITGANSNNKSQNSFFISTPIKKGEPKLSYCYLLTYRPVLLERPR